MALCHAPNLAATYGDLREFFFFFFCEGKGGEDIATVVSCMCARATDLARRRRHGKPAVHAPWICNSRVVTEEWLSVGRLDGGGWRQAAALDSPSCMASRRNQRPTGNLARGGQGGCGWLVGGGPPCV